ncbi:MAG: uroporphyrinogen decarboxylase family protein, partial [Planctomycetota bacterium]
CWAAAQACGAQLFDQDSDGDMRPVIADFLDAGINVMHPFEPAAGMDSVVTRQTHGGSLAIKGGIDKHVLRKDEAAIEAELQYRLQDCMRTGYVAGLDHRIPNGTPLASYRFYVHRAKELLGITEDEPGWMRMAF